MADSTNHGIKLTRFLEKEWDALGVTRGGWCRVNGLADSTVLRWSTGTPPTIDNMVLVAEALNRKLVDILYYAGYLDEDSYRVRTVAPPRERVDTIDVIRTDTTLTREGKSVLIQMVNFLRAGGPVANGRRKTLRA